jgi:hypothetical protein
MWCLLQKIATQFFRPIQLVFLDQTRDSYEFRRKDRQAIIFSLCGGIRLPGFLLFIDRYQLAPGCNQRTIEINGLLISLARPTEVAEMLMVVAGFLKGPGVMRIDGLQL